jgi:hypothetical protein
LVFPAEFESGAGERVVAPLSGGMALGEVGGVGGDLVGDDADFDIVAIGQAEVFFRRDVAEHGGAEPADHRGADGRGDVVIAGGDVGGERARACRRAPRRTIRAACHVLVDLVHRHVAGAFDHDLDTPCSQAIGEFAEDIELGELRFVVGVGDGAGAQAVAE